MNEIREIAFKHENGVFSVLDQQRLPHEECWVECRTPDEMIQAIKNLKVRGAPLIGVSAALYLARFALDGAKHEELIQAANDLRKARPTAVNLMFAVDEVLKTINQGGSVSDIVQTAFKIYQDDLNLCKKIGENGAVLINDGDNIIHHCNTGSLATSGIGTASGVIVTAHEQGKKIHVYVDETRPLLQGGRLTTWELDKRGIPYTLICDNMAGMLMQQGKIQKALVGSDRIALNGDFANKIGTYGLAVLCKHHGIPFYPAAPSTTIDFECETGAGIPIELRSDSEVKGVNLIQAQVSWAPDTAPVYNPAFDVTPVCLISGMILESGVYDQKALADGALKKLKPR